MFIENPLKNIVFVKEYKLAVAYYTKDQCVHPSIHPYMHARMLLIHSFTHTYTHRSSIKHDSGEVEGEGNHDDRGLSQEPTFSPTMRGAGGGG